MSLILNPLPEDKKTRMEELLENVKGFTSYRARDAFLDYCHQMIKEGFSFREYWKKYEEKVGLDASFLGNRCPPYDGNDE